MSRQGSGAGLIGKRLGYQGHPQFVEIYRVIDKSGQSRRSSLNLGQGISQVIQGVYYDLIVINFKSRDDPGNHAVQNDSERTEIRSACANNVDDRCERNQNVQRLDTFG